ncbi:MAG: polysaccharide pyruvyl transferase CsaB [Patescibacteria group bacterium]
MAKKVVICGNYGATNLGDEAILTCLIAQIRKIEPSTTITVMSANPRETAKKYGVKAVPFLPAGFRSSARSVLGLGLAKSVIAVAKCDLFILGGGGLFTDEKPHAILIWGIHAKLANLFKKKVYMYAQSVGPLEYKWSQKVVQKLFRKATHVSVRDQESKDLLDLMDIQKYVDITADPAILLPKPVDRAWDGKKYMILSVRPWIKYRHDLNKILAQYCDWLYKNHKIKALLLPFQESHDNDTHELNKIFAQTKHAEVLDFDDNLESVLQKISGAEFVVGMRLHSLIFACLTNTPLIGLSYSQKVENFLRSINMQNNRLDIETFTLENLQNLTQKILSDSNSAKSELQKAHENLKAKASIDEKTLTKLLI